MNVLCESTRDLEMATGEASHRPGEAGKKGVSCSLGLTDYANHVASAVLEAAFLDLAASRATFGPHSAGEAVILPEKVPRPSLTSRIKRKIFRKPETRGSTQSLTLAAVNGRRVWGKSFSAWLSGKRQSQEEQRDRPSHHSPAARASSTANLMSSSRAASFSKPWKKYFRSASHQPASSKRAPSPTQNRELPPLPPIPVERNEAEARMERLNLSEMAPNTAYIPEEDDLVAVTTSEPTETIDFTQSIERVKSCGWYWGPISGEAAERLLNPEPDGSFVVRDSSDDHYLFSLSFKLNGDVRHVRIEHDHGNFSFGTFTTFKSNTIVDFIENAVKHSRSGRYLFFLHRRPVLGPMRVQLLHPVSRFKLVQSLQHQCRFTILKHVPRDLLYKLPLPERMLQYLNTPFYYSEEIAEDANSNKREKVKATEPATSTEGATDDQTNL